MICDNGRTEFNNALSGGLWNTLNNVGAVPDTIQNVTPVGSFYKFNPFLDSMFYTNWTHTNSTNVGNDVYTTHDLITPIFTHFPDVSRFPPGVAIEGKIQVYALYPEYLDSNDIDSPDPVLKLLDSDSIHSLTGFIDAI